MEILMGRGGEKTKPNKANFGLIPEPDEAKFGGNDSNQ